jgi:acetyl-CoA acyltransferase 2
LKKESLYFVSGKRTAFGSNGGSFRDINPTDLAICASQAAISQAKINPDGIDHVIFANVLHSASDSVYLPRHLGLRLGIPESVPALGINRLCGSGFQVIVEAYQQMLAGDCKVALVGGVENMSMSPYVARNARWGMRMGHASLQDTLVEVLNDSYVKMPMALTAENLAGMYNISRAQADEFALRSQSLFNQALDKGYFLDEIAPYSYTDSKGKELSVILDEHPKPGTTLDKLGRLKPVFKSDGLVTAGNASGVVDGAAALIVCTESELKNQNLTPLGRMVSYGISGCDPKIMGIGPVPAANKALSNAKMKLEQMDLIEVNEAFAPQTLAVQKELKIPDSILNVNGGAIAIGHPLAASGTRIIQTLLYELKRRKKRYALGSACIGGGQGIAIVIESLADS